MRLAEKVVIITGGAGGLGSEASRLMAKEGAKVVVTDVAEKAGNALAIEIGGKFYKHDVSSEEQWQAIVRGAIDHYGRVDALINAAGIEGDLAKFSGLATTLEEWRRVMSINLDGTFLGCRTVMPSMLETGRGSIVNISSIVSFMATPTAMAYGASKAGVQQLTRSLAWIGAQNGKRVRCNSVHPGIIKTRMTDDIISALGKLNNILPEEAEKMLVSHVPFGVRGRPVDIANLVVFLASDDESAYITGSEFQADGGWHMVSAG